MSRKFVRDTVLTLAALLVANSTTVGLHAASTGTIHAASGPGGGGGNDPGPCTDGSDNCVVRAL